MTFVITESSQNEAQIASLEARKSLMPTKPNPCFYAKRISGPKFHIAKACTQCFVKLARFYFPGQMGSLKDLTNDTMQCGDF